MTDLPGGFIVKDPSWDDDAWTRVPNEIVRDRVLTLEAKGLILFLASHSISFKIDLEGLRVQVGIGREKLRKLLRELESAGYLTREATFQVIDGMNRRGPNRYQLGRTRSQQPNSEVPQSQVPENRAHEMTRENSQQPDSEAPGTEAPQNTPSIKKNNPKNTSLVGASAPSPRTDPRGHRLPDDFRVSAEMVLWCRTTFPGVDGRVETEKFMDYWHSKAGAGARKVDWERTWKNWIRTAAERQQTRPGRPRGRTTVHTSATGLQIER